MTPTRRQPHVVVVGGGFAGVECVKRLRRAPVRVTLIDRSNHHLFQPLLYQVATAALSPANIAAPIREIFARDERVEVVLAEAVSIDPARKSVALEGNGEIMGDALVIATGLVPIYFGHDDWRAHAPPLKMLDDATEIRGKFLLAFESAELEEDESERRRHLTFVVIGGGPTGVEMAGALAELSHKTIRRDFRRIDPASSRIVLIEGRDRVLPAMHPESSERARADLERLGVEVMLETRVDAIDERGVTLDDGSRIETATAVWAAGVAGSPLGAHAGGPVGRDGRVEVGPDLSVPGHPDVFVLGDLARVKMDTSGREVPGVAQGAMQMGRFVGDLLRREAVARSAGQPEPRRGVFRYTDKGTLATIGRDKAVAEVFGRRFAGRTAFGLWAVIHIYFLVGYRNRLLTFLQWIWHYLMYDCAARLIMDGARPRPTRSRGHAPESGRTSPDAQG